MKVKISYQQNTYGRGFHLVIYTSEEDTKKLRRKIDYAYKKHGIEELVADLENIRYPQEE